MSSSSVKSSRNLEINNLNASKHGDAATSNAFTVKSKNTHVILPLIGPQGSAKPTTTASDIATPTLKQPLSRGPTIYQQLIGVDSTRHLTQNIRIDSASFHMAQSVGTGGISRLQLEKMRGEKDKNIKEGKKNAQ
ncbi:hypothetical protein OROMI_019275 [Orobanche minor]